MVLVIAGGRLANSAANSLRNGTLPSHGSLPCSSSRTIDIRRPSGAPLVAMPSGDFSGESLFVWNAAIQTLGRENAQFGLRHVEPTAVLRVRPESS